MAASRKRRALSAFKLSTLSTITAPSARARPSGRPGAEGFTSRGRTAPSRGLHHNGSRHMGMQGAEVVVRSRSRESKRVFVVRVQHLRLEGLLVGNDSMRDVVLVGPRDRRPSLNGQALRREGEVVDLHLHGVGGGGISRRRSCPQKEWKHGGSKRRTGESRFHYSPFNLPAVFLPFSVPHHAGGVRLSPPAAYPRWRGADFRAPR